jgi:hypothetical protein
LHGGIRHEKEKQDFSPRGEPWLNELAFVSGHGFSHAEMGANKEGLQPLSEAVLRSSTTEKATAWPE